MGNILQGSARALCWIFCLFCLGWGCGEVPIRSTTDPNLNGGSRSGAQTAAYTHYRADGNRLVEGRGGMPAAPVIDIPLDGIAEWVVAAATGNSSVWVAVLEDGTVQAFRLANGTYAPVGVGGDSLIVGMPPALVIEGQLRAQLLTAGRLAAPFSHPVILPDGRVAFIDRGGGLIVVGEQGEDRLALDALPDARILVDELGRLALYNRPTTRYAHGVLGDIVEAAGVAIVNTDGTLRLASQIDVDPSLVAEGIAPLWVDWDGDGRREIVTTLSDDLTGARVAVFAEDGTALAMGQPVGRGFDWRHVVACAPFIEGELELVGVRTPHTVGIVEFYALRAGAVEVVAELDGFTSHVVGTRNLDLGLVGDFDGDGSLEILLPTVERTHLAAVGRTASGARRLWQVDLGGEMTSNLAAAVLVDDSIVVGAAHAGQRLRIWLP